MSIHKLAEVHKNARIGQNVKIGPFCVIGPNVEIGDGTVLESHVQVTGFTTLGKNNHIFKGAVLGSAPQDLKYKGDVSYLKIGDRNIIREFTTFNVGAASESETIVGSDNYFMAYSHVAHNCIVGNHNIFANMATLAGHVEVGDYAVIGGLVGVHQFVRIGSYSMVGGLSKIVQDVTPYMRVNGNPAKIHGLNIVGLKRHGFSEEEIRILKHAFKTIFMSSYNTKEALARLRELYPGNKHVDWIIDFIEKSHRGVIRRR